MTAKAIKKYNKKGIFTVQQLSYLFKPRRKRKKRKNSEPIKHSLELQALAIRENKIYIQEMPELPRQPVELYLEQSKEKNIQQLGCSVYRNFNKPFF